MFGGGPTSYIQALAQVDTPARYRALDPFTNHAWVYAAANHVATALSQAPFTVYREDGSASENIRRRWRAGRARSAWQRRLMAPLAKRLHVKSAEPDYSHPIAELLTKPNPLLNGSAQLMWLTDIWLAVRGEVFWVLTGEDGGERMPGEVPVEIWPLGPDLIEPALSYNSYGRLIGWWLCPPPYLRDAEGPYAGRRIPLALDEVIQFKVPNPNDPVRGISPFAAVAQGIETDLLVKQHSRNLLKNSAVPKGIITFDGTASLDPKDEEEWMRKWKEMQEGVDNAGRTALLQGGFKYQSIAMSPADMEALEQLKLTREEILAVVGVPPSSLGLTNDLNYATQLGQDKNFWERRGLPLLRLIETSIDGSLFFNETDNVFGAFDLTGIEALRVGMADQVTVATQLAGDKLHAPPRVAFQVVGLEVPEFEGDENAFVSPLSTTVEQVLSGDSLPAAPAGSQAPAAEPNANTLSRATRKGAAADRAKRWRQFAKVQTAPERAMSRAYRSWVAKHREHTFAKLDALGARRSLLVKAPAFDIAAILPGLDDTKRSLRQAARPVYASSLETIFNFTLDDIGIPTFQLDDDRLVSIFANREAALQETVPKTLWDKLFSTVSEGVAQGETLSEIRARVAHVYDVAASSAKTLQVARTETASFMNTARREMFELQGFDQGDWVTAEDEHVRESHVLFGEQGPVPLDFNYLTLTGEPGELHFPGDPQAPAGEVINCLPAGTPVETGGLRKAFRREYAGQLVEVTLRSGARFACTPNHPVLGPQGWIAAQTLRKGDSVLRCPDSKRALRLVEPHSYHAPSAIEQVFASLSKPGVVSCLGGREQFHGDGMDGEVDIVGADRLLRGHKLAKLAEVIRQLLLAAADVGARQLFRACMPQPFFLRLLPAANGNVSGFGEAQSFGLGRLAHPDEHRGAATPRLNPEVEKYTAHHDSGDAESTGQRQLGLAFQVAPLDLGEVRPEAGIHRLPGSYRKAARAPVGPEDHVRDFGRTDAVPASEVIRRLSGAVTADQVVSLTHREFRGHVFNLETEAGFYLSHGIIQGNCRCLEVPA